MTRSPQYLAGVVDARRMILLDSTTARVDPLSTNTSISILRWDSFHRGSSFKWKLEHDNKVLHKTHIDTWQTREIHSSEAHSRD